MKAFQELFGRMPAAVNRTPAEGDRGIFAGGWSGANINTISYTTISSASNAQDFGDLLQVRSLLRGCSNGAKGRGVFISGGTGGGAATYSNIMEYITILTLSNAYDFGDLNRLRTTVHCTDNRKNDRGIQFGGYYTGLTDNQITYITISTTSNAQDFGDILLAEADTVGCSNGTFNRGINAGGYYYDGGFTYVNDIEYVTISSLSNSVSFGDLLNSINNVGSCSNTTLNRGIFAGEYNSPRTNVISYITISTPSNAQDFGDLTAGGASSRYGHAGTSNGTANRGIFGGGYESVTTTNLIDYISIDSLSNAQDFGELTVSTYNLAATSDA